MALQGELWIQSRALDVNGEFNLRQAMAMVAVQYWATRKFWLRGAFGYSSLTVGGPGGTQKLDSGVGVKAAAGYEILSTPSYGLDLQLAVGSGSYAEIEDQISVGTLAVGFTWY